MQNNLIRNKYKIQDKLGKGGFGNAYKVLNIEDNIEYVIKEIPLNNENEEEKKKIENEGKLLSSINSEYVVKYFDSFIENSKYYIVMELCDGDNLDNFIEIYKVINQSIPEKTIIDIFKHILLGVKEIHAKNIIHRDLKPLNIFISLVDNKIKIGDFGISKQLDPNKNYAQTQIGTILYVSPELIKGEKYTNKTDIWSLGCILYELCELKLIFPYTNKISFYNSVLSDKPKDINKKYGKELQDLINKLLEKDPSRRPDINSVIDEFKKCEKK